MGSCESEILTEGKALVGLGAFISWAGLAPTGWTSPILLIRDSKPPYGEDGSARKTAPAGEAMLVGMT